jgi:hypothetical protein
MTTSDALEVSGGAGGVTATYEDMLSTAAALNRIGDSLTERNGVIGAVIRNGDLIESTVLSPGTAAQVAGQVTAATIGPHGLVTGAASMKATALCLTVAVEAYQELDAALAQATTAAQAVGAPAALAGLLALEGGRAFNDLWRGDVLGLMQLPGQVAEDAGNLLYSNPWIVDGLITDSPAMMWMLSTAVGPVGTGLLNSWTTRTEGVPFPPTNVQDATGDVVAFGTLFGAFQSRPARATPLGGPETVDPNRMSVPTSLKSTMAGVGELGGQKGTIRVFDVPQADGTHRWVVEIPGTQEWSTTSGANPVDTTNNVRLMAGQQTEQNEAVRQAMRQAGIKPGDPVMLAGHSQGGITAASLAGDPATRDEFHVTNVYTGGAPVARFPIPDDVHVLSIEHDQDAVPRLDGRDNPDRPGWVTVNRDPTGVINKHGDAVSTTAETHDSYVYTDTAGLVDQSTDPGVVRQRESFQPFFSGTGDTKVTTYQLTRDPP